MSETFVRFDRLRQEIDWWLAGNPERTLRWLAFEARCPERRLLGIRQGESCSVERVERLLEAMDYVDGTRRHPTSGRMLPLVIVWGKGVNRKVREPGVTGRLKTIDPKNAKLTYAQLKLVHRAHVEHGLSLRELSRRHWDEWGYANEKACLNSLSSRLREAELPVRSQSEATALANRARPNKRLPGETYKQYRRRARAEERERDPAAVQAQAERIAWLRANH